jgi:hypothetical protein
MAIKKTHGTKLLIILTVKVPISVISVGLNIWTLKLPKENGDYSKT